jgi:hypothetical protein
VQLQCVVASFTKMILDTDHILGTIDLLNGTYACENDKILNDILKREHGFKGCEYIVSRLGTSYAHGRAQMSCQTGPRSIPPYLQSEDST